MIQTAPMRSSFQSCTISEESYCAPWDLKIQEEKFKLLNEQYQPFHRTYSAHTSAREKSFASRQVSPPVLPPLPPGGLIPSCFGSTANTSQSEDSRSRLNNSLPKIQSAYDPSWDLLQTSLINNLHGKSLPKISTAKQNCSSPTFPIISSCQYFDDAVILPIDRYFWYHHTMSRRQAEYVLESRPSGSFLVRQSESGNPNGYSLSIKTTKGCMHMRISCSKGFYILGECSRPFPSVSCMIKYFSHTTVPIRGAAHIKLGTPILRWEILPSSLSHEELL